MGNSLLNIIIIKDSYWDCQYLFVELIINNVRSNSRLGYKAQIIARILIRFRRIDKKLR